MQDDIKIREGHYHLPIEFEKYMLNRTMFLTGVGRSGTTILGKIVGSMENVFYLFEPAIIKLAPFMCVKDPENSKAHGAMLRSVLLEDYFFPAIQGRSLNYNKGDDSYCGNYLDMETASKDWEHLSRRSSLVGYMDVRKPYFAIKMPELQPLAPALKEVFGKPKFMHIIRNGNDVVSSSLSRGWFDDEYMNISIVDWVLKKEKDEVCSVPWYIDEESRANFASWDQLTRSACVWRCLTEQGMKFTEDNPGDCFEFRYEDFVTSPYECLNEIEKFAGIRRTKLTEKHIGSVKGYKLSVYEPVCDRVHEAERPKFRALMEKLGYI